MPSTAPKSNKYDNQKEAKINKYLLKTMKLIFHLAVYFTEITPTAVTRTLTRSLAPLLACKNLGDDFIWDSDVVVKFYSCLILNEIIESPLETVLVAKLIEYWEIRSFETRVRVVKGGSFYISSFFTCLSCLLTNDAQRMKTPSS